MNKYIRGIWLEWPAVVLLAWTVSIILIGSIINYFLYPYFGRWSALVSFPITWFYAHCRFCDHLASFLFKNLTK